MGGPRSTPPRLPRVSLRPRSVVPGVDSPFRTPVLVRRDPADTCSTPECRGERP
ncbi:hypothetical protein STRTUCAR8_09151 [Streptomyces turgidiscabies Car8]|uniref:Uncharacterized protein n=1 Tax=Streptomyces turgidiscabies (strain Car8) TaxID=698760 RepID=L7FE82_STRT8|nr:hypothetical protein STRTUCAR8_09151 [Streptomyces turgidiscabies Car8]